MWLPGSVPTQVIDILIPAVILMPHAALLHSRLATMLGSARDRLLVDLLVSATTTDFIVAAVGVATPWIVDCYGIDYTNLAQLFVLLFATQWLNGTGRPAIRYLAAHWNAASARRILLTSLVVAS